MRYLKPLTVAEAVDAIGQGGTPLAGGTVAVPLLAQGQSPSALIDLQQIESLRALQNEESVLRIGAMVTLARLASAVAADDRDRCLGQAALAVGNPNVRNAATVGGNVVLPAGDLLPALLVLQATIAISAPGQADRDLPGAVLSDGGVPAGVLIRQISIPHEPGRRSAFVKFAWRAASGITLVAVAASLRLHEGKIIAPRLAAAGLRARVARLPHAERRLAGQACGDDLLADAIQLGAAELHCETDPSPTEAYRRRLVAEGLRRVLTEVTQP